MVIDVATWPTVRQVTRKLDVSQGRVSRLITSGRLQAVKTPLGYFINPASLAEYEAERTARKAAKAC